MLTGEIRSQIDRVWDAFWTGGISNPLEVIEQLTYLLFIKRLDEEHTRREKMANRLGRPIENPIFMPQQERMRWSRFRDFDANTLYMVITDEVFPFMKNLSGRDDSPFATHMKDARFTLPPEKAGLLAKVVDMLDRINMDDRDTKGDVYEYMLGKLATAGQNGQFRTPRHIIKMMVQMVAPTPQDNICDPACGTAGFLVAAAEHLTTHHPGLFHNDAARARFDGPMFHGFDFDSTMLRIATMNMLLHGIGQPDIRNKDSLSEDHSGDTEQYSLILANPPFAGSLDYESTAKDLQSVVRTKKTELLFIALFLRLLKPGGRAAVIVPDGVLFGSSNAHRQLRELLVEKHRLEAIVSMPSGVFKPYAGVSTAILFFTKTNAGGTDAVWFYDMQADGFSLDDKRTPLDSGKYQPQPSEGLTPEAALTTNPSEGFIKHENNNIPDIIRRFQNRAGEQDRPRTAQSFLVPKAEIAANEYDLSLNRYKEIVYDEIHYDPPQVILAQLEQMEVEIQAGLAELKGLLVGNGENN